MFTVIAILSAAIAIDAVLAADAKLAMKRADLTLDYVSRVTLVPVQRLSDQLNGKTPFTCLWRFFTGEMRETDFALEFYEIQLQRADAVIVRGERLTSLLLRLDLLLGTTPKQMAKADLPMSKVSERIS